MRHKYKYVHHDGTTGFGSTSYNAVHDALGVDKGNKEINRMENQTSYLIDPATLEYVAEIYDIDGNLIGKIYKL